MQLKLIGLNHKTAPIRVREQVTIPEDSLGEANLLYKENLHARESMLLSTCNRVEAYLYGANIDDPSRETIKFLNHFNQASVPDLNRYIYTLTGEEAITHVLRVASGLDSMVIGEAQVTGQLKSAYSIARKFKTAGKDLSRLMSYAFFTAKKVRNETRISELPVSVSSVAVDLARKIFEDLTRRKVLLIGAGKMSRLAARGFLSAGVEGLRIVNRTPSRARLIAEDLGQGRVCEFEKLGECLADSDIVIVSTGARGYLLTLEMMERIIRIRKNRPLFVIDIAVPRNADPAINGIDNIFLYDIDSLVSVVNDHLGSRVAEAELAEDIIRDNVSGFIYYTRQMSLGPLVKALREKVEEICLEELESSRADMPVEKYEEMREMMFRTVNRLSHPLIQEIKNSAEDFPELLQNQELLEKLVKEAFELKEKA